MRMTLVVGLSLVLCLLCPTAPSATAGDEVPRNHTGVAVREDRLPKLVLITPGTKVGKEAPKDWSHLIIKSMPMLESGDLASLPAVAKSTATMFRTILLADVRRGSDEGDGYELRRVGLGVCLPIKGVDTVVSTASLNALGVSLNFIPRRVLVRTEEEILRGRLKAKTQTFALYSAPVTIKVGRSHVQAQLRYALLVDPETGVLRTLLWPLAADPQARKPPRSLLLLPPGLTFNCGLDVISQKLLKAIATDWSFAMAKLPPGEAVALPEGLQPWTVQERLPFDQSAALESELRLIPQVFHKGAHRELVTEDTEIQRAGIREIPDSER